METANMTVMALLKIAGWIFLGLFVLALVFFAMLGYAAARHEEYMRAIYGNDMRDWP
jgi:hypothetical protein